VNISQRIWDILACPSCGGSLSPADHGAKCPDCGETYTCSDEGQLDLRLRQRKVIELEFELGTPLLPEKGFDFAILETNSFPEVDFTGIRVPRHLTPELLSYFPRAKRSDSLGLDLGCGSTIHREVCQHAGFEYVGLDYDSPAAPILGDAHALPFKDSSFEFVLSIAVLEHIRYPFVVMKETCRVLESGGWLVGTVAASEPFHDSSYYHHTHLGTFNSLQSAGFDIKHVAPNPRWSVLAAHSAGSLFPRLPRTISKGLVLPIDVLHRIWWKLAYFATRSEKAGENSRVLLTTGSFSFVARKR
jgi:SAM-dependent methyltransferase